MKSVTLKYRHIFGEASKDKFEQVNPTTITCDSTMIKGNSKFISFIWQSGGGGVVCVLDVNKPQKLPMDYPMIKGNQGAILDLEWYPFDDNYLATASMDGNINLWSIPDQITEDIITPQTVLQGHDKKVNLIQWNPSAAWIIGSASHDQTVKVWDVQAGTASFTTSPNAIPLSIDWNGDGSLIGSTWNDKKLRIIDPRQQAVTWEAQGHHGTKPQRFTWLGSTGHFISTGFNKQMERELMLWDSKKLDAPLSCTTLDQGSGVIYPVYDDQLGVLYLTGKGDSSIKYMEFQEGGLHYLNTYTSTVSGKGYAFFPKRNVDVTKCEVMKAMKIQDKSIEVISFIAPRRTNQFQDDLYPECPGLEAALTAAEWLAGKNSNPKLVSLRPEDQPKEAIKKENVVFQQKEQPGKIVQHDVNALLVEIDQLKLQLEQKDAEILQLKEALSQFKA